jgi:hypothetical protein
MIRQAIHNELLKRLKEKTPLCAGLGRPPAGRQDHRRPAGHGGVENTRPLRIRRLAGLAKYARGQMRQRGSSPKLQVLNTALISAQDSRPLA